MGQINGGNQRIDANSKQGGSIESEKPPTRSHLRWNFLVLTVDQILLRIGWIFKTESIIMPAVLDTISGAGWLRGCLPLLNRFGQSIPPLILAPAVGRLRRKRSLIVICGIMMSACFFLLAMGWSLRDRLGPVWAPTLFLLIYAVFFATTGIHQLVFFTLQGKLIPVVYRGRLLLACNLIGAPMAAGFAFWLLPQWLGAQDAKFSAIFGFTAVAFFVAAMTGWLLREERDPPNDQGLVDTAVLQRAWQAIRSDRALLRLSLVAACFGSCIVLFPHYQSLGRTRVGFDMRSLLMWVVIQNIGTAIFSMVLGPVADKWGNRRVLLIGLLGIAIVPCLAIASIYLDGYGKIVFSSTFLLVGLTPVMYRVLFNYSLELCKPADHPRYLSVLGVATSIPAIVSPLVGQALDQVGYELVFIGVTMVLITGWFIAFGMPEPRFHREQTATAEIE